MSAQAAIWSKTCQLKRLSSNIFQTVYNPSGARTGHKILRARLDGPRLATYYPDSGPGVKQLNQVFSETGIKFTDWNEVLRCERNKRLKARGKGAPKKGEGKQASLKKKK